MMVGSNGKGKSKNKRVFFVVGNYDFDIVAVRQMRKKMFMDRKEAFLQVFFRYGS